jgi:hypothetical protein
VERPLDPGPVVVAECPDVLDHEGQVRLHDLAIEQAHLGVREAGFRPAAEVHDDLDQGHPIRQRVDRCDDLRRQRREQRIEIVDRFAPAVVGSHADLLWHGCVGLSGRRPARGPVRRHGRGFLS